MIKICWIWTTLFCLGNNPVEGETQVRLFEANDKILYKKLDCKKNSYIIVREEDDKLKICLKDNQLPENLDKKLENKIFNVGSDIVILLKQYL